MNCYVCGFPRPEGAKYCPGCGRYCADDPNVRQVTPVAEEELIPDTPAPADIVAEESVTAEPEFSPEAVDIPGETPIPETEALSEPEQPVNPPRKPGKRHRPVLIPLLIMAVLFTVGTIAWFALPYDTGSPDVPTEATQPANKKPPLPAEKRPAQDDVAKETLPATDDRCFRISNGVVSFIPERYDGSPILVIPSEIDGQTVTAIAAEGFAGLEDVTTLVLPETLEIIGDRAFENCTRLRGVYIPDSVESIGESAFRNCIDMESVSISVGTTTIGKDAFDGCASLMYIFYEGTFEQWEALYHEYVTPFTYAICADGEYYHGTVMP